MKSYQKPHTSHRNKRVNSVDKDRSGATRTLCPVIVAGEHFAEWPQKPSFIRPIRDREDHACKRTGKVTFQRFAEIHRRLFWIIGEYATAPSSQHKRLVLISPCDRKHAMNPLPKHFC